MYNAGADRMGREYERVRRRVCANTNAAARVGHNGLSHVYKSTFTPYDEFAAEGSVLDLNHVTSYVLALQFAGTVLLTVVVLAVVALASPTQEAHCALRSVIFGAIVIAAATVRAAIPSELTLTADMRNGLFKLHCAFRYGVVFYMASLVLETLAHSNCSSPEAHDAAHDVGAHTLFGNDDGRVDSGGFGTLHSVAAWLGFLLVSVGPLHRAIFVRSRCDTPVLVAAVGAFWLAILSTPLPAGLGPLHAVLSPARLVYRFGRAAMFAWLYAVAVLVSVPTSSAYLHATAPLVLACRGLAAAGWTLAAPVDLSLMLLGVLQSAVMIFRRVHADGDDECDDPISRSMRNRRRAASQVVGGDDEDDDADDGGGSVGSVSSNRGLLSSHFEYEKMRGGEGEGEDDPDSIAIAQVIPEETPSHTSRAAPATRATSGRNALGGDAQTASCGTRLTAARQRELAGMLVK